MWYWPFPGAHGRFFRKIVLLWIQVRKGYSPLSICQHTWRNYVTSFNTSLLPTNQFQKSSHPKTLACGPGMDFIVNYWLLFWLIGGRRDCIKDHLNDVTEQRPPIQPAGNSDRGKLNKKPLTWVVGVVQNKFDWMSRTTMDIWWRYRNVSLYRQKRQNSLRNKHFFHPTGTTLSRTIWLISIAHGEWVVNLSFLMRSPIFRGTQWEALRSKMRLCETKWNFGLAPSSTCSGFTDIPCTFFSKVIRGLQEQLHTLIIQP